MDREGGVFFSLIKNSSQIEVSYDLRSTYHEELNQRILNDFEIVL